VEVLRVTTTKDEKVSPTPVKAKKKAAAMGPIDAAAKVHEQKEELLNDISSALLAFREAVGLGYHLVSPRHSYSGGFPSPDQESVIVADGQTSRRESASGPETQFDSPGSPASDADGWSTSFGPVDRRITSDHKTNDRFAIDADDELQKWADSIVDYSKRDPTAQGVQMTVFAVVSKSTRDRACADFADAIFQLPENCEFRKPLVAILRAAESATWEDVGTGRRRGPTPLIEELLDDLETERRLNSGPPQKTRLQKNGSWVAGAVLFMRENPGITDSEIAAQFRISASTVCRNKEFKKAKELLRFQHGRDRVKGTNFDGNIELAVRRGSGLNKSPD
jgi:hypothetical protein